MSLLTHFNTYYIESLHITNKKPLGFTKPFFSYHWELPSQLCSVFRLPLLLAESNRNLSSHWALMTSLSFGRNFHKYLQNLLPQSVEITYSQLLEPFQGDHNYSTQPMNRFFFSLSHRDLCSFNKKHCILSGNIYGFPPRTNIEITTSQHLF